MAKTTSHRGKYTKQSGARLAGRKHFVAKAPGRTTTRTGRLKRAKGYR
ncbi:hypothetical protein HY488_00375 [Candidatus Woesearchaeota archaeon]|nr:hypothetical protein [Candidatus Woesearchaeota archaeon]